MRFTRLNLASADELRKIVLDDIDAVSPGLRVIASAVPLPGCGTIDVLAADQRGALTLIAFALEADPVSVARCVGQWSWIAENLGIMRSLMPVSGVDLTAEPRAVLVAASATDAAIRLASLIALPRLDLLRATVVASEGGRGVLIEAPILPAVPGIPARSGLDPVLCALPPGETRSLMRRVIEELRGAVPDGASIEAVAADAAVDLVIGNRVLASLVAGRDGLEVRRWPGTGARRIVDDEGCREAVRFIASPAAPATPSAAPAAPRSPRPPDSAVMTALTEEELAEFERIAGPRDPAAAEPQRREPASVSFIRSRFVEN